MSAYEAVHLEPLVFRLVLDADQAFCWRTIIRQLEDPAQQDRHVLELDPSALLDCRKHEVAQIGIRAPEVEVEFYRDHRFTISPQKDAFPARMSTHREA